MTAAKVDMGRRLSRITGQGKDGELQMFWTFSKLLLSLIAGEQHDDTPHTAQASGEYGGTATACTSIYKLELPSPARCHDDADAAVAAIEPREATNVDSKASYLIQIKNPEQPPSSDGRGGDKIKPRGPRSSRDGTDRASSSISRTRIDRARLQKALDLVKPRYQDGDAVQVSAVREGPCTCQHGCTGSVATLRF
uniref:Uncharacterized protein n=2 Tax=Oryza TaxID=4527 RepID=A0A0D3HEH9_9ORYZ